MKKITLTAALLLLALTSFAQFFTTNPGKSRPYTWRVDNATHPVMGSCPYALTITMALFNSSNVIIPGTSQPISGTVPTAASGWFSYPQSPAPGNTVRITAITVLINGSSVSLPITGSYYPAGHPCSPTCTQPFTDWMQMSSTVYRIAADCII